MQAFSLLSMQVVQPVDYESHLYTTPVPVSSLQKVSKEQQLALLPVSIAAALSFIGR